MHEIRLLPRGTHRVLSGHPWVFEGEFAHEPPAAADGEAVLCRDARGRGLGSGIYNSASRIRWRRFAPGEADFDRAFLERALGAAVARRGGEAYCRLAWSESDDVPGLVVDRYGDVLVVQALTLAVDRRLDDIVAILAGLLAPRAVVLRNDAPVRNLEGLPLGVETRQFSGAPLAPEWHKIGGIEFLLDLEHGQKTGFYLDQRASYARVAAHAAGRRVLDAFCNQGAFALACVKAGATDVLGVDASADAVEAARGNAGKNGLAAAFEAANVFDFLREARGRWGLVVLDPPPFAKSRKQLPDAMRGYKELNLRALAALAPGGILATFSCSHHVGHDEFLGMVAEAAADAGRRVRVLEHLHQPPDHPVLLSMPESEYLRGLLLEAE